MTTKPNPGSAEALKLGCTCPVLDNAHGQGYGGNPDQFIYSGDCPVHTMKKRYELDCFGNRIDPGESEIPQDDSPYSFVGIGPIAVFFDDPDTGERVKVYEDLSKLRSTTEASNETAL